MSEKTCPNCGAALMPGDIFCGECGVRMQEAEHDIASTLSPDDIPVETVAEPVPVAAPTAGEYVVSPPAEEKGSGETVLRVVVIVLAVGFLLGSLCLCSFGGFTLVSTDTATSGEDLGMAVALCFVPGVILGLIGAGAAYFGFRKQ